MKKIYTTPIVIVGDDVVNATLGGLTEGNEIAFPDTDKPELVGSVGYYL